MNDTSSRSHAIFTINFTQVNLLVHFNIWLNDLPVINVTGTSLAFCLRQQKLYEKLTYYYIKKQMYFIKTTAIITRRSYQDFSK